MANLSSAELGKGVGASLEMFFKAGNLTDEGTKARKSMYEHAKLIGDSESLPVILNLSNKEAVNRLNSYLNFSAKDVLQSRIASGGKTQLTPEQAKVSGAYITPEEQAKSDVLAKGNPRQKEKIAGVAPNTQEQALAAIAAGKTLPGLNLQETKKLAGLTEPTQQPSNIKANAMLAVYNKGLKPVIDENKNIVGSTKFNDRIKTLDELDNNIQSNGFDADNPKFTQIRQVYYNLDEMNNAVKNKTINPATKQPWDYDQALKHLQTEYPHTQFVKTTFGVILEVGKTKLSPISEFFR